MPEFDDDYFRKNLIAKPDSIDSSANAIVLYEKYDYTLNSNAPVVAHTVRRIIKILKKGGTSYADVEIPVYHDLGHFSKVLKLSGTTYNLEGDKIVTSSLDVDNIMRVGASHMKDTKFSMPSVREGSIIDYSFEVDNDVSSNFCTWMTQWDIPKLYTELDIKTDKYYNIQTIGQNGPNYLIGKNGKSVEDVSPLAYCEKRDDNDGSETYKWVRKNVPALYDEPFISSIDNYREELEFFIVANEVEGEKEKKDPWEKRNTILLNDQDFYKALTKNNKTVAEKAELLTAGQTTNIEKAKKIYAYVRDSITTEGPYRIWIKSYPGTVLDNKTGTVTETNMLLISMLQDAGIDCDPVILSTKANGEVTVLYPGLSRFNYTICEANIDGKKVYLDASDKYNPFGMLPSRCYNGYARVITKNGRAVILNHNTPVEKGFFKITTTNNDVNNYQVSMSCYIGEYEAKNLRKEWNADTSEIKKYVLKLLKELPLDMSLEDYSLQHLNDPEAHLVLNINAKMKWDAEEKMIFLNPYFHPYFPENPFTTPSRKHKVELPYTYSLTYFCKLQLPAGYTITDSLASLNLKMGDNVTYAEGVSFDKQSGTLSINSNTSIASTDFTVEEYPYLKEFFNKLITQQQKTLAIQKL